VSALSGTVGLGTYTLSVRPTNACGTSPATPAHTITVALTGSLPAPSREPVNP
jgi:hypothetical protein